MSAPKRKERDSNDQFSAWFPKSDSGPAQRVRNVATTPKIETSAIDVLSETREASTATMIVPLRESIDGTDNFDPPRVKALPRTTLRTGSVRRCLTNYHHTSLITRQSV
jgi:hypothetical protein